ncbi:MAG: putative secondary metabolism biosynthetic enzyme [Piccolia ochrophora]|nr:MAG: putative secondary metabolism biosynthetic enzyme [Piccolia ochrophora]
MTEAEADVALKDFPSIFSLDGKVIVVTGGTRGLGLHAASGFLQSSAGLVIITSRKATACDAAAAALNALPNLGPGARAVAVPADLSTLSGVEALVRETARHTDHVDVLMANAGATWGERFDTHGDDKMAKVLDLNVRAVFNCVRL